MNQHPAVKARLAALRKAAEDAVPYKKHEAINDLITMIHASPAEAGPDNPLCETRMGHEGPYHRFPCKLAAILQLIRLMGWNKPEKIQFVSGVKKMDSWDRFKVWIAARYAADSKRQAKEKAPHGEQAAETENMTDEPMTVDC